LGLALLAATAHAQSVTGFELERLRLQPGAASGLLVDSADFLDAFGYRAALTLHDEEAPLVLRVNGPAEAVVARRLGLHLSAAFAPTEWLEVGAQLPVILDQRSDLPGQSVTASGVSGTPWLSLRAAPWQQRRGHPLDLSVGVALGLPVGSAAALSRDEPVAWAPTLAVGRTFGWLRVGGNVSLLVRPARLVTPPAVVPLNEVGGVVSTAVVLATTGRGLRGELSGRLDVPTTQTQLGGEVDVGLRLPLGARLEVYLVGGPGFGAMPGTPAYRVLAGVALVPPPAAPVSPRCAPGALGPPAECPEQDFDGDGVLNRDDACPEALGTAARGGCPEVDTDGDGLLDSSDACPQAPGAREARGCPPPDGDGDGVPDVKDACPAAAGDAVHDGCPDSDGDGLFDDVDRCPALAGVPEAKGCPDADGDGDGLVDRLDACRNEAGPRENFGCPAGSRQLVSLEPGRLVIREKVSFASGQAAVLPRSFPLLQQVARILKEHPDVERVTVEGHTDSQGPRELNLSLSQARAEAVRRSLVEAGVAPERLAARGFGPDRPLESNATAAGREVNRRVEFVITSAERSKKPVSAQ
jgi:outer membrane protein OmpA-like peptidoglycan-associated protein